MKIAVDLTPTQTGERFRGIGVYAAELARALADADSPHEFLWVVYAGQPMPSIPRRGRPFRIRRLVPGKAGALVAHHLALPWSLAREGVRVLHCVGVPTLLSASGIPLVCPCRLVVTVHDLAPLTSPEAAPPTWYRRWYYRLMLGGVRRAARIMADSGHTRDAVIQHLRVPPERVRVVSLAPQSVCAPPPPGAPARAREAFGLPERFVLAVGDTSGAKDFAGVLETLRRVRAAGHEVALVVAGRRHPVAFLVAQAEVRARGLEGVVRFLGFVPGEELGGLYASAAAVLALGRAEGFGLPPLEAMACGTPVVAARAGSLPEVLGEAPLWVAPGRPEESASALQRIFEDEELRRELSARGRRRAAEFSWARAAREALAIYEAAVA